ncbi:MAG: polymerase sigma-70 factor, subfamily [Caulobacteraceae bacterium]|nr:polymerase sigma-70 factor, subfamily [Caulobacteraceae bacterium]
MSLSPASEHEAKDALLGAYFERRANLVRFFAARTGSMAEAEDLAQDLYLRITARKEPVEAHAPVALLYRIATNLLLDQVRGAKRSRVRDTSWRTESRPTLGADEVAPEAPADEALISRERLRQLAEAVAGLPPQMQRAFRLHKLEAWSQAETARAMGVSVKAVEKHISAAIHALSRRLQA